MIIDPNEQARADSVRALVVLGTYPEPIPVLTVAQHTGIPTVRVVAALAYLGANGTAVESAPGLWRLADA